MKLKSHSSHEQSKNKKCEVSCTARSPAVSSASVLAIEMSFGEGSKITFAQGLRKALRNRGYLLHCIVLEAAPKKLDAARRIAKQIAPQLL